LKLNEEIESYDKTLKKMRSNEIKEWVNSVLNQLKKSTDLENDEFLFLLERITGKFYSHILSNIKFLWDI